MGCEHGERFEVAASAAMGPDLVLEGPVSAVLGVLLKGLSPTALEASGTLRLTKHDDERADAFLAAFPPPFGPPGNAEP